MEETAMDENMRWHREKRGTKAVEALEKNGFAAVYRGDRESATEHVLNLVPDNAVVGCGGSMTISELGLKEKLTRKGCVLLDHGKAGLSLEERGKIRRSQLTSDVFLCSSNAVTLEGELVNVDATGNRVAAMMFGPGRVIVAAGVNKIVGNFDEAEARIKSLAAPVNSKRLNYANPCAVTGTCANCGGKTRICNLTTIIRKRPPFTDIHVVIIGEELGY
jgi:L-lactate utilization protein LutB